MSGHVICPKLWVSGKAEAKMWVSDVNIITVREIWCQYILSSDSTLLE